MPDERPVTGWTVETLHEHLEDHIQEKDKQYDLHFESLTEQFKLALAAADRAVSKAEMAMEKRFEAVNEFRSALADQQRTLMSRQEFSTAHEQIDVKYGLLVGALEKDVRQAREDLLKLQTVFQTGKAATDKLILALFSCVGAIGVIVGIIEAFVK